MVSNMGCTLSLVRSATKAMAWSATNTAQTDKAKYARRGLSPTATPTRPKTSPITPSRVRCATAVSLEGPHRGVAPKIQGSAKNVCNPPTMKRASLRKRAGSRNWDNRIPNDSSTAASSCAAQDGHSSMCRCAAIRSSAELIGWMIVRCAVRQSIGYTARAV